MASGNFEPFAQKFVQFLNKCTDPFHVVAHTSSRLTEAGFTQLSESQPKWADVIKPGAKCFFTRNSSTICAFTVGKKYAPGNGFKIMAGHTDSPCLKLKPHTNRSSEGYYQIAVAPYGGGIWHTWFDRDLAISGRVLVKDSSNQDLLEKLVKVHRPLLKVPNICIHLNRDHNEKFSPNPEKHLLPIISTIESHELLNPPTNDESKKGPIHSPVLLNILSRELNVPKEAIIDFELALYNYQDAVVGGAYNDFVFSGRQDNLSSCFIGLEALLDTCGDLEDENQVRMAIFYDDEEVGSTSFQGAQSRITESALRRIVAALNPANEPSNDELFEVSVANSFLMSWDAAHYVHPNYSEKHEDNLKPKMNLGPILKVNQNMRYATSSRTAAIVREMAVRANCPIQTLAVRNDSPCGSTIGPLVSAALGIQTVDIGVGCLSMHSIRETGGVKDISHGHRLLKQFFAKPLPVIN